jgi:hypothetical protein
MTRNKDGRGAQRLFHQSGESSSSNTARGQYTQLAQIEAYEDGFELDDYSAMASHSKYVYYISSTALCDRGAGTIGLISYSCILFGCEWSPTRSAISLQLL